MNSVEYIKKYLEYLSSESIHSHIKPVKTFQEWKLNYIETRYFTNAIQ